MSPNKCDLRVFELLNCANRASRVAVATQMNVLVCVDCLTGCQTNRVVPNCSNDKNPF